MRPSCKFVLPLLAGAALFCGAAAPANAGTGPADPVTLAAGTVLDAVKRLKPGDFIWAPQIAPSGPVLMVINISTQRAVLYRNGVPIGITTVSTGKAGHLTPLGVFTVLQKQVEHFSSIYDNAPMPYMQRLTWGGVALHGGSLPGYPASHGCIRLPKEFARLLYGETHLGMTVMIVRTDMLPAFAPTVDPLPPQNEERGGLSAEFSWRPERAPEGPITILVSATDKVIVVLRNGRQIGAAPVTIDVPVTRPMLFVLQSVDSAGRHWASVALPGQGAEPVALSGGSVHMPDAFRSQLLSITQPGTTVLVTADSVGTRSSPRPGRLLESE